MNLFDLQTKYALLCRFFVSRHSYDYALSQENQNSEIILLFSNYKKVAK